MSGSSLAAKCPLSWSRCVTRARCSRRAGSGRRAAVALTCRWLRERRACSPASGSARGCRRASPCPPPPGRWRREREAHIAATPTREAVGPSPPQGENEDDKGGGSITCLTAPKTAPQFDRLPPKGVWGSLRVRGRARTGDSPRREKTGPPTPGDVRGQVDVAPLQQFPPLQRSVSSAHPVGVITNGMVTRLALRADALGLELIRHRAGGWAVTVPAGVVHGPVGWDDMVRWIAETEAERAAYAARAARARERLRV
jgi:hypothetical protein